MPYYRFTDSLSKLHNMLEGDLHRGILRWSAGGDSFVIEDMIEFSRLVLPELCGHQNITSFLRQLNKYSFSKANRHETKEWVFRHKAFLPGQHAPLSNIKRKKKSATVRRATPVSSASDTPRSPSPDPLSLPPTPTPQPHLPPSIASPVTRNAPERPLSPSESQVRALQSHLHKLQDNQHKILGAIQTLEQGYGDMVAGLYVLQDAVTVRKRFIEVVARSSEPSGVNPSGASRRPHRFSLLTDSKAASQLPRDPALTLESLAAVAASAPPLHQRNARSTTPLDTSPPTSTSSPFTARPMSSQPSVPVTLPQHGSSQSQMYNPASPSVSFKKRASPTGNVFITQQEPANRNQFKKRRTQQQGVASQNDALMTLDLTRPDLMEMSHTSGPCTLTLTLQVDRETGTIINLAASQSQTTRHHMPHLST